MRNLSQPNDRRRTKLLAGMEHMVLVTIITVAAVLFFKVIILDPNPQGTWLREDGLIENAQALLFLAAAIGFIVAARSSKLLKAGGIWRYGPIAAWVLLMFVFFGEEISWGQRLLDLQTPTSGVFATNIQGEINIHNLPALNLIKAILINYFLILVGVGLPLAALIPPIRRVIQFFAIPVVPLIYIPLFIGTYLLHSYQIFSFEDYGYMPREYSETLLALAMALFAWHGANNTDSLFYVERP